MKENIKKMSNLLIDKSKSGGNDKFQVIEIIKIKSDPNQPRKEFNEEALKELADSIAIHGVMTPIIVAKLDEDNYIIRQGERRYRASLLAGKKDIPAILDNSNDFVVEKQLIENIARESLSMPEIAEAIRFLIDEKKVKKNELAKSIAKSNAYVSNYYAFATFNHPLKEDIISKTQDLLIITELKRLLKNASEEESTDIESFIISKDTLNRNDLDILKHLTSKEEDTKLIESPTLSNNESDRGFNKENNNDTHSEIEEVQPFSVKEKIIKVELTRVIEILEESLPEKMAIKTIKKLKDEFEAQ